MGKITMTLDRFTVVKKNDVDREEPYLWVFGILIGVDQIAAQSYVIKKNPTPGNLGGDFTKGESRSIDTDLGQIDRSLNLLLGNLGAASIIAVAWEHDNTPDDAIKAAYNDCATVLNDFVKDRVANVNTTRPTQAEMDALKDEMETKIKDQFKAGLVWYNPLTYLNPDDFIDMSSRFKNLDGSSVNQSFTMSLSTGGSCEYTITGTIKYTP